MGDCQHLAQESEAGSEESESESEADGDEEVGGDDSGVESENEKDGEDGEDGLDGVVGDVEPSQPPSLEVEPGDEMNALAAMEAVEEEQSGLGEGEASGHRDFVAEEPPCDYFPDNQEGLELSPEPKPVAGCSLDPCPDLDVHTCARPLRRLCRAESFPAEHLPTETSVEPVLVESDDDGEDPLCN